MRIRILLVLSFVLLATQLSAAQAWNPQKTWVFMVGLVEWKDKEEFEPFPQEDRKDIVLRDLLKQRGVPAAQIVYLQDKQATTSRINLEFSRTLAKTRPGDWLIVYFEGHGYKDDEGEQTFLASYDASEDVEGWPVTSIPATIEKEFKGSHAMIALDNCYSGAMADAVRSTRRKTNYAVMASSLASQSSTGNWTFTEALINAFRGASYIDRNLDGKVTFFEMGENAKQDMLFGEEQLATVAFTGSFDPQTVIGDSLGVPAARVGERVEAYSVDGWYKGFIIDAKSGKFKVHYYGYEDADDEWVAPKMIRDFKPRQYAVGSRVSVEWEKKWYPAKVLEVKGGVHYISYDNYGPEWNEWVGSARIRKAR